MTTTVFNIVETNEGVYLNQEYDERKFYNGENGGRKWLKQWIFLKNIPTKYGILTKQPNLNFRYELIDKSIESDKFPAILDRDIVTKGERYENCN